jgi:hypothetical protein
MSSRSSVRTSAPHAAAVATTMASKRSSGSGTNQRQQLARSAADIDRADGNEQLLHLPSATALVAAPYLAIGGAGQQQSAVASYQFLLADGLAVRCVQLPLLYQRSSTLALLPVFQISLV